MPRNISDIRTGHGGTLVAWGDNSSFQLGDGTNQARRTPISLPVKRAHEICVRNRSTLALDVYGAVWGWGVNSFHMLGHAQDELHIASPTELQNGIEDVMVSAIAAGARTTYALSNDGGVFTWGSNLFQELGTGSRRESTPWMEEISELSNVTKISAGGSRAFAVDVDGIVWAWGDNSRARLGDGTDVRHLKPVRIHFPTRIAEVAVAERSTYALDREGNVWAWGENGSGELGNPQLPMMPRPVRVTLDAAITKIFAKGSSAYAVDVTGRVWGWGSLPNGKELTPIQIQGIPPIASMAIAWDYVYAADETGRMWFWGDNKGVDYGKLAHERISSPIQLEDFLGVLQVDAYGSSTFAITMEPGAEK